jgi:hypothetical protein
LLSLGKQNFFLINRLCAEIKNAPPGDGEAFFGYGVIAIPTRLVPPKM